MRAFIWDQNLVDRGKHDVGMDESVEVHPLVRSSLTENVTST